MASKWFSNHGIGAPIPVGVSGGLLGIPKVSWEALGNLAIHAFAFLSNPGVPGVRSMSPDVRHSKTLLQT